MERRFGTGIARQPMPVPKPVLRLDKKAREAELKGSFPRVLHLATHGFFLSDQESKSTNSLARSSAFTRLGPPEGGTPNDWENPMIRWGITHAETKRLPLRRRGAAVRASGTRTRAGAGDGEIHQLLRVEIALKEIVPLTSQHDELHE